LSGLEMGFPLTIVNALFSVGAMVLATAIVGVVSKMVVDYFPCSLVAVFLALVGGLIPVIVITLAVAVVGFSIVAIARAASFIFRFLNNNEMWRYVFYGLGVIVIVTFPAYTEFSTDPSPENGLNNNIPMLAFAVAGIIGASIAILFSFSTNLLHNLSNLFSIQYSTLLAEKLKGIFVFWGLAILSTVSCVAPFLKTESNIIICLILILWGAFCLIYELYRELRNSIKSDHVFKIIETDAKKKLQKLKQNYALIPKLNPKSDLKIGLENPALDHIRALQGIGLRLMDRNELHVSRKAPSSIFEIFIKHFELGNGYFLRNLKQQGGRPGDYRHLTAQIFDTLQSIGNQAIQRGGKENVYTVVDVHRNIIIYAIEIKYADNGQNNPILDQAFVSYEEYVRKVLKQKNRLWIRVCIASLSEISKIVLIRGKTENDLSCFRNNINSILLDMPQKYFPKKNDGELLYLSAIFYLDLMEVAFENRKHFDFSRFVFDPIFNGLKKYIVLLSKQSVPKDSPLSYLEFLDSHLSINQAKALDNLDLEKEPGRIPFLIVWGEFFRMFAGTAGLNGAARIFVITSIKGNLGIIKQLKKLAIMDMRSIYQTHVDILLFRLFKKDDSVKISKSELRAIYETLPLALIVLLEEIEHNLDYKPNSFEFLMVGYLVGHYINLVRRYATESRFDLINSLLELYAVLKDHKYGETDEARVFLSRIKALIDKLRDNPRE